MRVLENPIEPKPEYTHRVQLPARLGDFEVTALLGEGGNGEVYAATKDGVAVALKILRGDLELTERERRRFLEEAAKMRRVAHPSIVPVLEAGTLPDGRPFLSMPRLEGETLAARLQRGPVDPTSAFRIFAELGDAVATLHRADLVHRDIKPENVLVTHQGRAVLLDLGIARDVNAKSSTTTEEGTMRGTRAYMAPERFFGSPAGVLTDLYELAVVLYLMLTGRLPWDDAAGPGGRLHPAHPDSWGTKQSPLVSTALLRALSTRPEVRPRSAEDFIAEIDRASRHGAGLDEHVGLATRSTERQPVVSTSPAPALTIGTLRRRRIRTFVWLATGLGVISSAAGMIATSSSTPRAGAAASVPVPDTRLPAAPAAPAATTPGADAAAAAASSAKRPSPPGMTKARPSPSGASPRSTEELFLDRQ